MFDNRKDYDHALLLVKSSIITSFFSVTYIFLSHFFGFEKGIYLMTFNFLGHTLLPLGFKMKLSNVTIANIYIGIGAFVIIILTYYSGGMWSGVFLWLIAMPILTVLLLNRLSAIVWSIVLFIVLQYFSIKTIMGFEFPIEYDIENRALWFSCVVSGLYLILFLIVLVFEKSRKDTINSVMQHNHVLKHQKKKIEIQCNELRKVAEDKDTLIRIIAHDLKNPLGNISSLVNFLKSDVSDENRAKYIDLIDQSTNKSQNLIHKILNDEESKSNVYDLQIEKHDINQLLNRSIELVSESASLKSIQLIRSRLDQKCYSMIDKTYFSLIIENILSNAIKFSNPNEKVFIGLNKMANKTLITIKDNGPGFSDEDKKRMFGKFERLSAKPTAGENSTGLGLSLVKKYVELIDGHVWCESKEGKGATFFVELKNC